MPYDVTIIGSGPGGYIAAIRCAQLGMKTAIVEKYPELGGTCLNVGCIPSKALLDSSELFYMANHSFEKHGIKANGLNLDWNKMSERKNGVVRQMSNGVSFLMKKNGIDVIRGLGSFQDKNTLLVQGEEIQKIESKYFIIATGSKPASIAGINADKKRIITSTEALKLTEIPEHLIVIGGGAIGLELGSVYSRLGSKVSVVEYFDSILPAMDRSMGTELQKTLKKRGFSFFTGHTVKEVNVKENRVKLIASKKDGTEVILDGDYCLLAVGRKPYTEGLGLEKIGIATDDRGRIPVDENLRTSVPHVFAIGDVIAGPMLAHKAEEEGVFAAESIAGQKPHIRYDLIPSVVYTWPEVASVGSSEEQLKEQGTAYKAGVFPFKANGRAVAGMETEGLVKVLSDASTDEIFGVHIIGPRAADLISEAVVAMEFRASAEDIGRISHAHPTFSEAIKEASLDATGKRALNF